MARTEEEVEKEVGSLLDSTKSGETTSRRKATVSMNLSAGKATISRIQPATDLHTNSEDELGA